MISTHEVHITHKLCHKNWRSRIEMYVLKGRFDQLDRKHETRGTEWILTM